MTRLRIRDAWREALVGQDRSGRCPQPARIRLSLTVYARTKLLASSHLSMYTRLSEYIIILDTVEEF